MGMGDVWRASVCVSMAGARLDVPILHARLNVENTGSVLRTGVFAMLDGWVYTAAKYAQQVCMAMAAIRHAHAQMEAHVILSTAGVPVLLASMETPVSGNAPLDSMG